MKTGKIEPLLLQGFKMVEKDGKKFIYAEIEKTRMFYSEKSGRLYLDLVQIEAPSEWSDYIVKESKKQDEEIDLPIVGNFKNYVKTTEETKPEAEGDDDFPF